MPKLSIIIPCYNCEKTLPEAVNSCFSQGFDEHEFEIILVDDASTDSTTTIMKDLNSHHSNIKLAFHVTNKGGGATRNTAAKVATADALFCLDSDDILPPLTLQKMYTHLTTKKCDGVGINTSIKFIGNNTNNVDIIHTFTRVNQKIELPDLLQKDGLCSLYSTFMITRTAFDKIDGYPTHHGFDTQGFAWRFLAAGLYAETCPQATYLHRVQFHESYYLREYNNGKTNFNWLEIFKENFYLFNDEAQRFIKTFDCRDFTRDIFSELVAKSVIFAPQKNNLTPWEPYISHKPASRNSLLGLFFRARSRVKNIFTNNPRLKSIALECIFTYEDIITRLKSRKPVRLLFAYTRLRIRKLLKIDFDTECYTSSETIDVVIPTIGKDFLILGTYLNFLKKNLCEKIGTIYVVSSAQETELKDFCIKNNLTFIDETSVLGYGKSQITYIHNGVNRSGWLFQQLLKLSGEKFVTNQKYVIVDSDTLLLTAHNFIRDGKGVFFESREWNSPYFTTFHSLFGYEAPYPLSLTSHMMLFDTTLLKKMKSEIENRHKKPWDQVYIDICDKAVSSGISDYETYAQWVLHNYPNQAVCCPFYNISLHRKNFLEKESLTQELKCKARSLSLHSYN